LKVESLSTVRIDAGRDFQTRGSATANDLSASPNSVLVLGTEHVTLSADLNWRPE